MNPSNYRFIQPVLVFMMLMFIANNVHAFGNACKNVNFSVDNENDYGVKVTKFDLWSKSEGRWLKNSFKGVTVPGGAKDFAVRRGENVQYGENDRITKIKAHYEYDYVSREGAYEIPPKVDTAKLTSTDTTITDPVCVAGRWYKATIKSKTRLKS